MTRILSMRLPFDQLQSSRDQTIPRARRTLQGFIEPRSIMGRPADLTGGIADHDRMRRNIIKHERSGSDQRILADHDPAHDRRIGPDRSALLDNSLFQNPSGMTAAGMPVINKSGMRSHKDPILKRNAFIHRNTILDGDIIPNNNALLNETMITNIAVTPDHRVFLDIHECPNPRTVPDPCSRRDQSCFVFEIIRHILNIL